MATNAEKRGIPGVLPVMTSVVEIAGYWKGSETDARKVPGYASAQDHDSLGFFQQRPSVGAWGTAEQVQDPKHALDAFLSAAESKKPSPVPTSCSGLGAWAQAVQGSAFPGRYAEECEYAKGLLKGCDAKGENDSGGTDSSPVASSELPPNMTPRQSSASSLFDNIGSGAGYDATSLGGFGKQYMNAAAKALDREVSARFPVSGSSYSGHPAGAADFLVSRGEATGDAKALGDKIAAWLTTNYKALNLRAVIWFKRANFDGSGWSSYNPATQGGGLGYFNSPERCPSFCCLI